MPCPVVGKGKLGEHRTSIKTRPGSQILSEKKNMRIEIFRGK
jgi:hypothetical protein